MPNIALALVFASAGVGLGVINAWSNASAMHGGSFVWDDATFMVAGLAASSALLSTAVGIVWARSKMAATTCLVAIILCTYVSVGYTLTRVGALSDHSAQGALAHNAAIKRLEDRITNLPREIQAERDRGGCGNLCKGLMRELQTVRERLNQFGDRKVVDSAGSRIEAMTGGWLTAEWHRTLHPAATAVGLELSVALLLGLSGMFASNRRPQVTIIPPRRLTRSEQVRQFVEDFRATHGREPSFSEALEGTKLPRSTVSKYRRLALIAE